MPEPERSIEELVEELGADVRAAQGIQEKMAIVNVVSLAAILRAVARLREYATHLPECATRHPRPADAPENQCSCGFAALTPKGGDRE